MLNAKTTEKRPKRVNKVQKRAYDSVYKKQSIVKVNLSMDRIKVTEKKHKSSMENTAKFIEKLSKCKDREVLEQTEHSRP